MKYLCPEDSDWFYPQILGTYEKELSDVINEVVYGTYEQVINVGAGEGYYAVGIVRANPNIKMLGFEMNENRRKQIKTLAGLNKVSQNVELRSLCDFGSLSRALGVNGRLFLLMDIEGGESLILDPAVVRELKKIDILVEVHEFLVPGVGGIIRERFSSTHTVECINPKQRESCDFPIFPLPAYRFLRRQYHSLMDEGRPNGCFWFHLRPIT